MSMRRQTTRFGLLALAAIAACSGSSAPSPPANAGSSGAFGVITLNGQQLMYYPSSGTVTLPDGGETSTLTVIDVGQAGHGLAGANAQVAVISLGSTDQATTTAGDAQVVLAAGTATYLLWFIDPTTNTVTKTLTLDPSLNGSSFSGGGGIVTGIAMDEANHRAILSVWNGFLFVDLRSQTVTGGATAAAAENFGFDALHQLIAAPYYECGQIGAAGDGGTDAGFCDAYQLPDGGGLVTAGLNLVDLVKGKAYNFQPAGAAPSTQPLGSEPDSAAFDPGLQILTVPPEGDSLLYFIQLAKAVYDDQALTFTAPLIQVPTQASYEGVAIESNSHLALVETEGSAALALVDLTRLDASLDGGLPPAALVEANMPDTPASDAGSSAGWSNNTGMSHDPHGITVSTGLQNGTPVGFLVSDNGSGIWVARIDLAALKGLGTNQGGMLTAEQIGPAITLLNGSLPR